MHVKVSKTVLAAAVAACGLSLISFERSAVAQTVIGNWDNPNDLMDGWFDWSTRNVYTQSTSYGVTNGTRSLRLNTPDDGGGRWTQSLSIRMHQRGFIDEFLASGQLAIDVSWQLSEWTGGNWSQVENLYVNSNGTGFTGMGRATDDTNNDPPWNGSWDTTNFGNDTRTLTWDMTALIDGDANNGEMTSVPSANGGGYLELIFATNYDNAFDPNTAAFYFDNARLLPRVVNSVWTGAAPDPDGDSNNGNAAANNWFASLNWTVGVAGSAGSSALFGTNGGALLGPQTVNTSGNASLGSLTFDHSDGYTIGGTGTLTLDVASGQANVSVDSGSHTIAVPVTLADDTTFTVTPAASTLNLTGQVTATGTIVTKAGAGKLAMNNVRSTGLSVNGGTVVIAPNGGDAGVSRVGVLSMSAGAALDLDDNDLIVTAGSYATISGLVAQARNGGGWDQPGITSTSAKNHPQGATTLGVLGGADYISVNGTTFGGFTVANGDTLVKYTWYGDTDFTGAVDFDDYVRTDGGFNGGLTGWFNGDFDLSGTIDFDDYVLIDLGFNVQSGTLRRAMDYIDGTDRSLAGMDAPSLEKVVAHFAQFGTDYGTHFLSAVPEPTGLLGAGAIGSLAMLVRRRRTV